MNRITATTFLSWLQAILRVFSQTHNGKQMSSKPNRFGDLACYMDVVLEDVVIQILSHHKVPARVVSEEHGDVHTGDSTEIKFTCFLDGLDGSSMYLKGIGNIFGTMFSVFAGENPKFSDWLFAGIVQPALKRITMASKEAFTVFIDNALDGCACSRREPADLRPDSLIYADEHFSAVRDNFSTPLNLAGYSTVYLGASAGYYAAVAVGQAAAALECTRKLSLEIITAYGVITQSGGVMIEAVTGNDLGDQKVLEYGAIDGQLVIAASSQTVANDIRKVCGWL